MDDIRRKIEEFQRQLIPRPILFKQFILSCPVVLPAIGLIIGLVLQFYFVFPLTIWAGIFILCLISYFFFRHSADSILIIVILCFCCLGGLRLLAFNRPVANDIRNITVKDFTFAHIRAKVISEPFTVKADDRWLFSKFSRSYPYTSFYAKVTSIKTDVGWMNACGTIKFYISGEVNDVNCGDGFESFCRLQKFSSADNPGQFNIAEYMRRNGVFLSASVKSANAITITGTEKLKSPFDIKAKFRRLATIALLENTESNDNMHLAEALLLGSRAKINRPLYNDFIKTGLVHLVALSGLHVGILAGFAWWVCKKAGLLHTGRSIACIIATVVFLLVVPAYSSILRAGIMFIVFCIGRMFNRRSNALNSLAVSAIFLLLIRPMDFLNPGFQLSFAALLGILLFYKPISRLLSLPIEPLRKNFLHPPLRMFVDMLSVGLAAWLAVIPIIAWHFYQMQLFTAILTVPASFPVTVILILGALKILLNPLLPTLAFGLAVIIDFSAKILSYLVTAFAKIPFTFIIIGKPAFYIVLLFYLLLLLWKFFPFRKRPLVNLAYPTAMILLFAAVFSINNFRDSNNLKLTVLSVGHGQAAVVNLPDGQNIIIDAGSISKSDIGGNIVNPFFGYMAIDSINSVYISHNDIDHYNGLPEILEKHNCKNIYTTSQFIQSNSETLMELERFLEDRNLWLQAAPENISIGKTKISVLWPKDLPDEKFITDNQNSLVLLAEYAEKKILFCSDITADVQKRLMSLYPELDIDLLITPHHGSGRTTDAGFLNFFKPEYLITSCSETRFSGVNKEIKEFERSYYTPKDGAITAIINSKGIIKIKTFR
ncbi:MAG: DNA internalization-related competence protein ComEC/Rec2 [Phycisphaerae bacterium]|nr:DNA internalization-related competence protein ComEC/Rec2 [Phycisphaerae bacterium]